MAAQEGLSKRRGLIGLYTPAMLGQRRDRGFRAEPHELRHYREVVEGSDSGSPGAVSEASGWGLLRGSRTSVTAKTRERACWEIVTWGPVVSERIGRLARGGCNPGPPVGACARRGPRIQNVKWARLRYGGP